jgi:hypothetical protein
MFDFCCTAPGCAAGFDRVAQRGVGTTDSATLFGVETGGFLGVLSPQNPPLGVFTPC